MFQQCLFKLRHYNDSYYTALLWFGTVTTGGKELVDLIIANNPSSCNCIATTIWFINIKTGPICTKRQQCTVAIVTFSTLQKQLREDSVKSFCDPVNVHGNVGVHPRKMLSGTLIGFEKSDRLPFMLVRHFYGFLEFFISFPFPLRVDQLII